MIMRIRVNQPFTFPKALKEHILKNKHVLAPYFHKNIINVNKQIHCTINSSLIHEDDNLKELVNDVDKLLYNLPFEAYCIVRCDNPDKILETGLKIPARSIFAKRISDELKTNKLSNSKINEIKKYISNSSQLQSIQFFLPDNHSYINLEDYTYYGGLTAYNILKDAYPNILEILKGIKNPYLIKCVIRYQHFNELDKISFITEIIKHYGYSMFSQYNYPISFISSTNKSITKNRIINIEKRGCCKITKF